MKLLKQVVLPDTYQSYQVYIFPPLLIATSLKQVSIMSTWCTWNKFHSVRMQIMRFSYESQVQKTRNLNVLCMQYIFLIPATYDNHWRKFIIKKQTSFIVLNCDSGHWNISSNKNNDYETMLNRYNYTWETKAQQEALKKRKKKQFSEIKKST